MHTIAPDLLDQNGQEMLCIPQAKEGSISNPRSKAHPLLKAGQQIDQDYIQESMGANGSKATESCTQKSALNLQDIQSLFDHFETNTLIKDKNKQKK